MPAENKVTITVNGIAVKIIQGTTSFQDIIAAATQKGAAHVTDKKITVVSAAASQSSSFGPNASYVISGGEVLTSA